MYDSVLPILGRRYRTIAPDYPGFGHSDWPSPDEFAYTFDRLAEVITALTERLGVDLYSL